MLECKSCTFKSSGRAILSAVGGHTGLLSVLKASHNTLHQVYNTTYPDEERALDELKLPLLERMMQLMGLLGDMTDIKGRREDDANELIRVALTEHGEVSPLQHNMRNARKLTCVGNTIGVKGLGSPFASASHRRYNRSSLLSYRDIIFSHFRSISSTSQQE